jgi:hypothetical protein
MPSVWSEPLALRCPCVAGQPAMSCPPHPLTWSTVWAAPTAPPARLCSGTQDPAWRGGAKMARAVPRQAGRSKQTSWGCRWAHRDAPPRAAGCWWAALLPARAGAGARRPASQARAQGGAAAATWQGMAQNSTSTQPLQQRAEPQAKLCRGGPVGTCRNGCDICGRLAECDIQLAKLRNARQNSLLMGWACEIRQNAPLDEAQLLAPSPAHRLCPAPSRRQHCPAPAPSPSQATAPSPCRAYRMFGLDMAKG